MSKSVIFSNIKRTLRYMKKNGAVNAYYAARERMEQQRHNGYTYAAPTEEVLKTQKTTCLNRVLADEKSLPLISIVMPAYRTNPGFLKDAVLSAAAQSYPQWELIIADASPDDSVKTVITDMCSDPDIGKKIKYIPLAENKGISANTNAAIREAAGDFVAFMDHDDLLTPDALYETFSVFEKNPDYVLVYSDEDKLDSKTGACFDCHRKYDFNYDLFLTNNYVCHLTTVRREYINDIRLRSEYDGAQDYDFVLQVLKKLINNDKVEIPNLKEYIGHSDHVLYHWRSHAGSTATNTASKMYAYDAGLKAVAAFASDIYGMGVTPENVINGCVTVSAADNSMAITVRHSKHLGFYSVRWGNSAEDIFRIRPEVGAVTGRTVGPDGKMRSEIKNLNNELIFDGLNRHYSGYMNRFDCAQNVRCGSLKNTVFRGEKHDGSSKEAGGPYNDGQEKNTEDIWDRLISAGYLIVYDPLLDA